MTVLVFGATGYIGSALILRLRRDGHKIIAATRDAARAKNLLGGEAEFFELGSDPDAWADVVSRADAVVSLTGARIFPGLWTEPRRRVLADSRIGVIDRIVEAIAAARRRPPVLVSASAVGYYGDRGDELLDEDSGPGTGFLAELCTRWEGAVERAADHGVREVRLRFGVVIGPSSPFVRALERLFRSGLGGVVGSGRQFVSWVHIDDLVEVAARALSDPELQGPVNCVSQSPVRNEVLTRELASALRRPAFTRAPSAALRMTLGEAATAVLYSQRAVPRILDEIGFEFRRGELVEALVDALGERAPVEIAQAEEVPDVEYLQRRPPSHLLTSSTAVAAPPGEVFDFFSRPENLGVITPPDLDFSIRTEGEVEMRAGARIEYTVRLGGVPLRWVTVIDAWEPGSRFADAQERGPYGAWWHEHRFWPAGEGTAMLDRVYYAPPLLPLGRLANRWFIEPALRRIFAYRHAAMERRFGRPPAGARAAAAGAFPRR